MRSVTIPSFAKVNLCLHILGRRVDKYHELRTIFQAISLHDTLTLSLDRSRRITLETDEGSLPVGEENLVWRALDLLRRELKLRAGVRAKLEKRIPVGRGLGGGSSNAAAALVGLLRLTRAGIPAERLFALASSLGADVPFFLGGGRALGIGRGDEIFPLPDGPRQTVLVVSPGDISVLTRDAYSWVAAELTKRPKAPKLWSFCALCWSAQEAAVSNDFETVVFRRHPRLARIKRELLRAGAAEAALAGSGSAVFGIFHHPAQARRAASALSGSLQDRVFIAHTLSRKEYLRALRWPGPG
jgi:4-diphosphocytidyl-2-C-methyl-D-erythritol kinase